MNPPDPGPEPLRDIIDFVEDFAGRHGYVAEVGPDYYNAFLALSEAETEVLARAVLNTQAKEARRLLFTDPIIEAPTRLMEFAGNTLLAIAIGVARFNEFGQLGLYQRVGPEPTPEVHDALTEKIGDAYPLIELAVRDFIRRQRDADQEAGAPG